MKVLFFLPYLLLPWCLAGQGLFTKVTDPSNPAVTFVNTPANYKGTAWIDLDGDNWPDLLASQRFLFRNDRNGSFTQWPDLAGAVGGQGAAGSSWGDIDNDGHPDAITASLVSGLHHNNGDNTFTLLNTALPNFTDYSAWDCALADADNNGRLDLSFVHACCTFHPTGPFPCRLYLQGTDGGFSAVTGYEFTDQNKPYTIPVWSDYDLDGDVDLFIGAGPAGTPGPDFCYQNRLKETGSFSMQRLTAPPFDAWQDGQTYNFPDYDNDGDLDIFLTNYGGAPSRFWRNDGNGTYANVPAPFAVQGTFLANTWGDIDNDGFLDVLISLDGTPGVRLYRNKGNGTFTTLKTAGTAGGNVCGIALADYDNDGDLDFYTNGPGEARALFRNDTLAGSRHWIAFTLQGTTSNRSAIGALVRVKATLNGLPMWQLREVSAHNSFQSQNDLRQHFGLADATAIDSIEVRWPSGLTERFAGQVADNFYRIVEGQGISVVTGITETSPAVAFSLSPNPIGSTFRVSAGEAILAVQVFDTTGRRVPATLVRLDDGGQVRLPESLAAGTYFVRVRFANGAVGTRTVVR